MIDCHSHILYGIDDGCKTIEDSIETIKNLKGIGFDTIILTPHYLKGSEYVANNKEKKERYNILCDRVKEENIDVKLYLGNEIYITDDIEELIFNKEVTTLNLSRYVLIELPLYNEINNVEDYIYELKLKGYKPIIAHPERYSYYQENVHKLISLYKSGVLFQSNYGSLIGNYGKHAMKLIKYMLKNNMITFMGTDIHRKDSSMLSDFDYIKRTIKKYVGEENFNKITHDNILKVINDECI